MTPGELDARVRGIVDGMPPLSGDQLLRLAALLCPPAPDGPPE